MSLIPNTIEKCKDMIAQYEVAKFSPLFLDIQNADVKRALSRYIDKMIDVIAMRIEKLEAHEELEKIKSKHLEKTEQKKINNNNNASQAQADVSQKIQED